MPQVNIQDVAKMAGVSVATVSRVLNSSPSVSSETRELVLAAIKKLNYQPNLLGRNLRRTETKLVLLLLANIANPFYSRIVKGMEYVAHSNGYNVMICNTDLDINREKVYLDMLKNRLADGVIFMSPVIDSEELNGIGTNFPLVQCCEYRECAAVSRVSIDNRAAAYKVAKHLASLGKRRIALVTCRNTFVSTIQREEGYRNALADAGIAFDESLVVYGDYGFSSGIRAVNQLLSIPKRPDAIFAISDIMAIGVIRGLRERGLAVPDDVAVAGFDNISFSAMCNPMLTTISQPQYDLGCIAMELMLKQIKGEQDQPQDVVLENELIIRESTVK